MYPKSCHGCPVNQIGRQWIFTVAWQVHLVWAVVLVLGGEPSGWCTAIAGTLRIFGGNHFALACFYASASACVILSMWRDKADVLGLLLCAPQQMAMLSSAIGAARAIHAQQFADGVQRPWAFITNDQISYLLIGVYHTFALLDVFAGEWIGMQWRARNSYPARLWAKRETVLAVLIVAVWFVLSMGITRRIIGMWW